MTTRSMRDRAILHDDIGAFEADFTGSMEDHYVDCTATDPEGMQACFGPAPDPAKVMRNRRSPLRKGVRTVVRPSNQCAWTSHCNHVTIAEHLATSVRAHGRHACC